MLIYIIIDTYFEPGLEVGRGILSAKLISHDRVPLFGEEARSQGFFRAVEKELDFNEILFIFKLVIQLVLLVPGERLVLALRAG